MNNRVFQQNGSKLPKVARVIVDSGNRRDEELGSSPGNIPLQGPRPKDVLTSRSEFITKSSSKSCCKRFDPMISYDLYVICSSDFPG